VDELSVSCYDLPRVKAAVRSIRADAVTAVAKAALACASAAPVRALVREQIDALMPSYLSLEREMAEAELAAAETPDPSAGAPRSKRAAKPPTRQMARPVERLASGSAAKKPSKPSVRRAR
jgi:hypothetical protein